MSVRLRALSFGALVVGSVITVDPAGLSPFGPSKWLVISTAAAATIAWTLRTGAARCHRRSWWMWVALLVLLTLSALVNGDAKVALLGHSDRHLGVITWVLLFGLFCAGQQLADQLTAVVRASVVGAAALGLYTLWELAFGPPVSVAATTRRLLGPFGSAAFLGAACCLLGPVALGVAFDRSQDRRWRWTAAVSATAVAIALVGSGTRGAWLAAAVTAAAVAGAVRPARRNLMWCAAGLLVAVVAVAPRLGDVVTRHDSGASRLDEWRVAARVIERHPVIGVGPEGYRIAFAEGVDDNYERSHRRDTVLPDRAHAAPLDVTLAGGLGAGILYVALLGFIGIRCWKMLRSRRPLVVGLGAAVMAYGVQSLLLFPLAELDPIWWVFAGVAVSLTSTNENATPRRTVVPVVAAITSAFLLVVGVLDVAADRLARTALRTRDHDVAIDAADRAVSLRPDNLRYRLVSAEAHLQRATIADIDRAIAQARRATQWSSKDPFAGDELATALSSRAAATGDQDDITRALAQWQRLVDRDPHRASWQLQLGRAAARAGNADLARQAWTVAAALGEPGAAPLLAALDASS
jgi:O-antigen ligase